MFSRNYVNIYSDCLGVQTHNTTIVYTDSSCKRIEHITNSEY